MQERGLVFLAMRAGPVRKCCQLALEDEGFLVVSAPVRTEELLAELRRRQPEMVLMEVLSPSLDFLQVLRQAKEEGLGCSFFTISTAAVFSELEGLEEAGCRGHFITPVDYPLMAERMLLRSGYAPRIAHSLTSPTPFGNLKV